MELSSSITRPPRPARIWEESRMLAAAKTFRLDAPSRQGLLLGYTLAYSIVYGQMPASVDPASLVGLDSLLRDIRDKNTADKLVLALGECTREAQRAQGVWRYATWLAREQKAFFALVTALTPRAAIGRRRFRLFCEWWLEFVTVTIIAQSADALPTDSQNGLTAVLPNATNRLLLFCLSLGASLLLMWQPWACLAVKSSSRRRAVLHWPRS
jgi:hypothetical protein